jgi:hypothetical protein
MQLLLFSGWSGVGKDAAAALLVEEFGYHRLAFADALKEDCANQTGLPLRVFHSYAKDIPLTTSQPLYPNAKTPREILIKHAALARRMDNEAFARIVGDRIEGPHFGKPLFVISDWRFLCELDHLRSRFPAATIRTVRMERPGCTPSAEPSEHELDHLIFDHTIANIGTISDLREVLKHMLHTSI